jgi:hypothetical protein
MFPQRPPSLRIPPNTDLTELDVRAFSLPRSLWGAIFGLMALAGKTQFWDDTETAPTVTADDCARAVVRAMTEYRMQFIPVGTIFSYMGDDLPEGWLFCDGQSFDRVDYPSLYAILPASLKNATSFTTPDLRERFIYGRGDGQANAENGGSNSIELDESNLPSHSHSYNEPFFGATAIGEIPSFGATGTIPTITGYTGASVPFDNRPAFMRVTFIIKATP